MPNSSDSKDDERRRLAATLADALGRVKNLSQFSRDTGIDRRALTRYSAGEIEPSATTLLRIARGLNVSVDQLIGADLPQVGAVRDAQYIEALEAGQLQMAQAMHLLASSGLALVPRLNVRVAAGIGKINYHERDDVDKVPVSLSILRRAGVQPENAHFITVEGDSMEEEVKDRDDVLVDISDDVPRPAGIYAVQYGEEAMLKRVQPFELMNTINLISDNPSYPPIPIRGDERSRFRVIGRAKLVMRVL